jgi:predicted DNA-binding protein (MmcQ/YjbR family)
MAGVTREQLRRLCLGLAGATEDFPFGDDVAVFRIGGKLFALLPVSGVGVNLKCEPERALQLRREFDAVAPGWHQNKRHWNTVTLAGDVPDEVLTAMVEDSYDLVLAGLPKHERDAIDIHAAALTRVSRGRERR